MFKSKNNMKNIISYVDIYFLINRIILPLLLIMKHYLFYKRHLIVLTSYSS